VKKLISVAIAIIAILALTVPVMAQTLPTDVTVDSGTGQPPIIKAKWEAEDYNPYESGDVLHQVPLTQILPPLVKNATKDIKYYAVATDPNGASTVDEVFGIVYHPSNSPAPYNNAVSQWGPYFKYKVVLYKIGHDGAAIDALLDAYEAGLVTFNVGFDIEELTNATDTGELDKGTADVYLGTEIIDYEQPAGYYTVEIRAYDVGGNLSSPLTNQFYYVPTCGIEVDFNELNYGNVNRNYDQVIAGDVTWNSPLDAAPVPNRATVRNIGNTWAHVTIQQTDMGFGKVGSGAGTTFVGANPPTSAQSNWNVIYDLQVGSSSINRRYYDPNVLVTMPNYLGLSTLDELDFSILVKEGTGTYSGSMTIGCDDEPFSPTGTPTGIPD
jgi:hypothetical protein